MRRFAIGLTTIVASVVFSLFLLEVGVRIATGSLLEWRNYATDPVNLVRRTVVLDFDPEIGWLLKKDGHGFGPWRNRIHKTSASNRDAPILAVGDSFTYGSEVTAEQSWPAQLEYLTGIPVINGGVGGFGVDQAALWAERLVPQVKPRLIIFSFIPNDITRTRMSIFSGAIKPIFKVVDGELKPQNLPLQPYIASVDYAGVKAILGYSKLIDWAADRLGKTNEWRLSTFETRYEPIDDVATSCGFVKRLAKLGVPMIALGQSGWSDFTPGGASIVEQAKTVLNCAREAGAAPINLYPVLRPELPEQMSPAYHKYFINGVGHMTPEGNVLVAEILAKFIADNRLAQDVKSKP